MFQAPLPPEYQGLTQEETDARIQCARERLGDKVVILGHHYQRDEIIKYADFRGDSYKLAKDGAAAKARLSSSSAAFTSWRKAPTSSASETRKSSCPISAAGCSMADMANIWQVRGMLESTRKARSRRRDDSRHLYQLGGESEGVCRRSWTAQSARRPTARSVLDWALGAGREDTFLPRSASRAQHRRGDGLFARSDGRLGPERDDAFGGNTEECAPAMPKFILWKGHCSVHGRFTGTQIDHARKTYPDVRVIVHPECLQEVVEAADDVRLDRIH